MVRHIFLWKVERTQIPTKFYGYSMNSPRRCRASAHGRVESTRVRQARQAIFGIMVSSQTLIHLMI